MGFLGISVKNPPILRTGQFTCGAKNPGPCAVEQRLRDRRVLLHFTLISFHLSPPLPFGSRGLRWPEKKQTMRIGRFPTVAFASPTQIQRPTCPVVSDRNWIKVSVQDYRIRTTTIYSFILVQRLGGQVSPVTGCPRGRTPGTARSPWRVRCFSRRCCRCSRPCPPIDGWAGPRSVRRGTQLVNWWMGYQYWY